MLGFQGDFSTLMAGHCRQQPEIAEIKQQFGNIRMLEKDMTRRKGSIDYFSEIWG